METRRERKTVEGERKREGEGRDVNVQMRSTDDTNRMWFLNVRRLPRKGVSCVMSL